MRHRRRGRKLGRSSSHRRALMRNLASSLILTERDAEFDDNKPKVPGRIVTTLQKAKTIRPYVEKCITIARQVLPHEAAAEQLATTAERGTDQWRQWRNSDQWQEWCAARAPVVAARRRVLRMLGDKQAVRVLFAEIAPRFADREGGYTRILRLAEPRLGDAGTRAILEFVGQHDRVNERAERPSFEVPSEDSTEDELAAMDEMADSDAPLDEPAESGEPSQETAGSTGGDDAAADQDKEKQG